MKVDMPIMPSLPTTAISLVEPFSETNSKDTMAVVVGFGQAPGTVTGAKDGRHVHPLQGNAAPLRLNLRLLACVA